MYLWWFYGGECYILTPRWRNERCVFNWPEEQGYRVRDTSSVAPVNQVVVPPRTGAILVVCCALEPTTVRLWPAGWSGQCLSVLRELSQIHSDSVVMR
jgi:hypothetical protein